MISLKNYIKVINKFDWDGHIHLFNASQSIYDLYKPASKHLIGFADIEYDNIKLYEGKMIDLYKQYIDNHYNSSQLLLATAPTAKEAIEVYEKFPNVIKGFGELKLYNTFKGKEVKYKKISTAREICSYISKQDKYLPVYIHYSLTNDNEVKRFDNLLKSYPNIPIVLCHCGMEIGYEDFAYHHVVDLMKKYSNLWVDISYYMAIIYFHTNPFKLYNLCLDRVILGSDFNIKMFGPNHPNPEITCMDIYQQIYQLTQYIDSDNNIKRLFKV